MAPLNDKSYTLYRRRRRWRRCRQRWTGRKTCKSKRKTMAFHSRLFSPLCKMHPTPMQDAFSALSNIHPTFHLSLPSLSLHFLPLHFPLVSFQNRQCLFLACLVLVGASPCPFVACRWVLFHVSLVVCLVG